MPFCPNCRYEYTEGATRCSTCGTALVNELAPPAPKAPRAVGLRTAGRLILRVVQLWVDSTRKDIPAFPRYLVRGAAIVFRHPILLILPLGVISAYDLAIYAQMRQTPSPASRLVRHTHFEPEPTRLVPLARARAAEVGFKVRVMLKSGSFIDIGQASLPPVLLPHPWSLASAETQAGPWYGWAVWLAYIALLLALTGLYQSGMLVRLRSLVLEEPQVSFVRGATRLFVPMAELVAFPYAAAWVLRPLREHESIVDPAWIVMVLAFIFAGQVMAVQTVHLGRGVRGSIGFVLRHLPAVLLLLVATAFVESVLISGLRPRMQSLPDASYWLLSIPGHAVWFGFATCIWAMKMYWYVEATGAERRPEAVLPVPDGEMAQALDAVSSNRG